MKVKSLSRVRLSATPWTVAHQALPSMGFSRQEYWSGMPLPSLEKILLFPFFNIYELWDFPGGPEVKTSPSSAGGAGLISGQGAKILHALWPKNQNIKHKLDCNKFN